MTMKLKDLLAGNKARECRPEVEYVDYPFPSGYDGQKAIYYTVCGFDGKTYKVFAFVGIPERPKKGNPAIVAVHGGGGNAFFEWTKKLSDAGYIAIAPDFAGQYSSDPEHRALENPLGTPKGKITEYGSICETDDIPDSWVYFGVLSAICAANVLVGEFGANEDKIGISGVSWGGFLALTATAAEKRFAAAAIIYSSAFISDSEWGMAHGLNDLSPASLGLYNEYLDPQSYLCDVCVPTLFAAGTTDHAFTIFNRKRTTDGVRGEKIFSYRPEFPHGHIEGYECREQIAFFDRVLCGENRFCTVGEPRIKDGEISVRVTGAPADGVSLVYTTEDCRTKDICAYSCEKIRGEGGEYVLPVPDGAKSAFVFVEQSDGLKVSGDLIFIGQSGQKINTQKEQIK